MWNAPHWIAAPWGWDVHEIQAGEYELMLLLSRSWDYGAYEVLLDGEPVSKPLDLFDPATTELMHRIPTRRLSAGRHELSFVNKGKRKDSPGYYFGFDGILLGRR